MQRDYDRQRTGRSPIPAITHQLGRYTWHHSGSHRSEIEIVKYTEANAVIRVIEAAPGSIEAMPVLHDNDAYEPASSGFSWGPRAGNYAVSEHSDGLRRKSLRDGQTLVLARSWPETVRLTPLADGQRANTHCT